MSSEPEWPGDGSFEHRLLDSARGDVSPLDGRQAWARFASLFTAPLLDPGADLGEAGPRGRVAAAGRVVTAPRAAWVAAAKWVVLGAISGSGLTAALLVDRHRHPVELTAAHGGPSIGTATVGQERRDVTPRGSEPPDLRVDRSVEGTEEVTRPRRPGTNGARALRHRGDGTRRTRPASGDGFYGEGRLAHEDASTLAAEVARIGDARAALSGGDPDRAVRLVEDYHRAFPAGVLAPDADVVALEAWAAKDDRVETAQRAARFLTRYPDDPHAAWVRALLHSVDGQ